MTAGRATLGGMIGAGWAAARRRWGLVLGLGAVQVVWGAGAALMMSWIVAAGWARSPLLDRAVAGDVVSLVQVVAETPELFAAALGVGVGAVAVYAVWSWFLLGGLNAVLLGDVLGRRVGDRVSGSGDRDVDRASGPGRESVAERRLRQRALAREFGAGGAVSFTAYLRLALWSLIPLGLAGVVAGVGLYAIRDRAELAVEMVALVGWGGAGLVPALALVAVTWAAVDYARVELTARALAEPGARLAARRALLRGYGAVTRDWRPLVHLSGFGLGFLVVTALAGLVGAGLSAVVALWMVRQVAVVMRTGLRVMLAGGQVWYANEVRLISPVVAGSGSPDEGRGAISGADET
ncbi:hypothetical protein [Haliangium sp.]|uniref:hypothetical protein n=1 Tax=Haliangium sp. TaxID=2663208 RepID=UPI003D0C97BA